MGGGFVLERAYVSQALRIGFFPTRFFLPTFAKPSAPRRAAEAEAKEALAVAAADGLIFEMILLPL